MSEGKSVTTVASLAAQWYSAKKAADKAVAAEKALRAELVALAFPNGLSEGAKNKADLPESWQLSVTGVVNRTVDEAALGATLELIKEKTGVVIDPADLIRYKPELKVSAYKELGEDVKKLFDNALVIKDGSPQVEVKLPKR